MQEKLEKICYHNNIKRKFLLRISQYSIDGKYFRGKKGAHRNKSIFLSWIYVTPH